MYRYCRQLRHQHKGLLHNFAFKAVAAAQIALFLPQGAVPSCGMVSLAARKEAHAGFVSSETPEAGS